jgi:alkaline phosphatase
MSRLVLVSILLAMVPHGLGCDDAPGGPGPRYVFLFIGDGMGTVQVHAAEAYLASEEAPDEVGGAPKATVLRLSQLPVLGMQTTSSWNALITDSAAAATAMSSGHKTASGVVAMDPTRTFGLRTIAESARDAGRAVGIVSSVSLDHATPAGFYAHRPSRDDYHAIAHQLVESGFDYFGGGGFLDPDGTRAGAVPQGNVLAAARAAGYAVAQSREEFEALTPGTKAIALAPGLDADQSLAYEVDLGPGDDPAARVGLAELTQKGIQLLAPHPGGFFMMVEGGKIDWAAHAHDARATIGEVLALDDAVRVALEFQAVHPRETLVVVTSDHETGGMSLGCSATGASTRLELLGARRGSFRRVQELVAAFRAADPPTSLEGTSLAQALQDQLGLDAASLSPLEKARLDAAYTRSMSTSPPPPTEEESLLYGPQDPLAVTVTQLSDQRAGICWTTFSHTAVPVPVRAGGPGAEAFGGFSDNTDLALRLARAMRIARP